MNFTMEKKKSGRIKEEIRVGKHSTLFTLKNRFWRELGERNEGFSWKPICPWIRQ